VTSALSGRSGAIESPGASPRSLSWRLNDRAQLVEVLVEVGPGLSGAVEELVGESIQHHHSVRLVLFEFVQELVCYVLRPKLSPSTPKQQRLLIAGSQVEKGFGVESSEQRSRSRHTDALI